MHIIAINAAAARALRPRYLATAVVSAVPTTAHDTLRLAPPTRHTTAPAARPSASSSSALIFLPHPKRSLHTSPSVMASDEDYAAFLDKANQSTSGPGGAQAQSSSVSARAVDDGLDPPAALRRLDATYASEADEPFEPVCLRWSGKGAVDSDALLKAIGHGGPAEELAPGDFDPRGAYTKVLDAVRDHASDSKNLRVFRVEMTGARAFYYVVAPDGEGRIVGVRALAVES